MNETPSSSEGELTNFRNKNCRFRSESRYKSPLASIAYLWCQGSGRETVWLANLSSRGIGLLSRNPIPEDTPVQIEIPALSSEKKKMPAVVKHATQQLNGDWLVGCHLDVSLTEEELENCLTFDSPFLSHLNQ